MKSRQRYEIRFDPLALDHFSQIEPKYDSLLQRTIKQQLSYEPVTETRNRKRMERETALGATWEVRCGPNNRFRIFYLVDVDAYVVLVVAIATKIGNTLYVANERFEL